MPAGEAKATALESRASASCPEREKAVGDKAGKVLYSTAHDPGRNF